MDEDQAIEGRARSRDDGKISEYVQLAAGLVETGGHGEIGHHVDDASALQVTADRRRTLADKVAAGDVEPSEGKATGADGEIAGVERQRPAAGQGSQGHGSELRRSDGRGAETDGGPRRDDYITDIGEVGDRAAGPIRRIEPISGRAADPQDGSQLGDVGRRGLAAGREGIIAGVRSRQAEAADGHALPAADVLVGEQSGGAGHAQRVAEDLSGKHDVRQVERRGRIAIVGLADRLDAAQGERTRRDDAVMGDQGRGREKVTAGVGSGQRQVGQRIRHAGAGGTRDVGGVAAEDEGIPGQASVELEHGRRHRRQAIVDLGDAFGVSGEDPRSDRQLADEDDRFVGRIGEVSSYLSEAGGRDVVIARDQVAGGTDGAARADTESELPA